MVAAALFMGLIGCRKSEATKAAEQQAVEKHDAQQKFKEAIAALKVCADGATHDEFRQAEMNLRTSFEVNKAYLDNVLGDFSQLNAIMGACDYCWTREQTSNFPMGLYKPELIQMQILNPSITNKLNFGYYEQIQDDNEKVNTLAERMKQDPDFSPKHNVSLGLSEISKLCEQIVGKLN